MKGWKEKNIRSYNLNSHPLTHHVVYVWLCASVVKSKTLNLNLKRRKKKSIRTYNLESHPLTHHVVYVWLCASVVKSKTLNLYLKRRKKKNIRSYKLKSHPPCVMYKFGLKWNPRIFIWKEGRKRAYNKKLQVEISPLTHHVLCTSLV